MKQKNLGKKIAAGFMSLAMVLTQANLPVFTTPIKVAAGAVETAVTWDSIKETIKGAYGAYGSFIIVSDDKITVTEGEGYTFSVDDITSIEKSVDEYGRDIIMISYNMYGEHILQFRIFNGKITGVSIDSGDGFNPAMEVSLHLNDGTETIKTDYVSRYESEWWDDPWDQKYKYTLPDVTFYEQVGKECIGWSYTPDGDVITESDIEVNEKTDLYAKWEDTSLAYVVMNPLEESSNPYEKNGINLESEYLYGSFLINKDHNIKIIQSDNKTIKTVICQCLEREDDFKVSSGEISETSDNIYTINNVNSAELTLEIAHPLYIDPYLTFSRFKVIYDSTETAKAKVSFDANGGSGTQETVTIDCGDYTLPTSTTFTAPEGMVFAGWAWSALEYDDPITDKTLYVRSDIKLYAVWKKLDISYEKDIILTADVKPGMTAEQIKNSIKGLSGEPVSVEELKIIGYKKTLLQQIPEDDYYDIEINLKADDKKFTYDIWDEYVKTVTFNEKTCNTVVDKNNPESMVLTIYNYSEIKNIGGTIHYDYVNEKFKWQKGNENVEVKVGDYYRYTSYDAYVYLNGEQIDRATQYPRFNDIETTIAKIFYNRICLCTNPAHMDEKGMDGFCDTCRTMVVCGTPKAKSGLEYTGNYQELIDASSANVFGGTWVYRLGEEGEFTSTIPQAKNAGSYNVYYMLKEDNIEDPGTEVEYSTVTIDKIDYPCEVPENVTAKCGQRLSDLPELAIFRFRDVSLYNGGLIEVYYVPEDTTNYKFKTFYNVNIIVEHKYAPFSETEHECKGCKKQASHDFVDGLCECGYLESCSLGKHNLPKDAQEVRIDNDKHGKECSDCHKTIATGKHNFATISIDEAEGKHYLICADCGAHSDGEAHKFIDSDGKTVFDCTICNAVNKQKCGENVYYTYSEDGSTLYIYGSGDMKQYYFPGDMPPWYSATGNDITSVVIEDGVTSVGSRAFYMCNHITSVTLPNTLKSIGYASFSNCSALGSVTIPDSVTAIYEYAFSSCTELTEIFIPNKVSRLSSYAFSGCGKLAKLSLPCSLDAIYEYTFSGLPDDIEIVVVPGTEVEWYLLHSAHSPEDHPGRKITASRAHDFKSQGLEKHKCAGCNTEAVHNYDEVTHICSDCNQEDCSVTGKHDFTVENTTVDGAKKSNATCTEKAVYYKSCFCGLVSDTETFEYGDAKGHTDENKDCYCDECNIVYEAKMLGASLALDGTFGVNAYIALPENILNADNVKMVFTVENGVNPIVIEAALDKNNTRIVAEKTYFLFRCDVPAKNMYSEITAKLVVDGVETEIDTQEFTVAKYAENLKADKYEGIYDSLVDAMLTYGNSAKAYFNDETVADYSSDWDEVKEAIGSHDVTMGDDYYGSSLLLKSGTVLRHYYTEDAEGRTEKDGFYYVDEVVPAHQYSGSGDYCVNDYIYKALTSEKADDSLKNLCVALYNYGKAAEKYIGGTK